MRICTHLNKPSGHKSFLGNHKSAPDWQSNNLAQESSNQYTRFLQRMANCFSATKGSHHTQPARNYLKGAFRNAQRNDHPVSLGRGKSVMSHLASSRQRIGPESALQECVETLEAAAESAGFGNILENFSGRLLLRFFELSQGRGLTPLEMINRLKLSMDTYEIELAQLEKRMDKAYFKELVLDGLVVRSGTERITNRQITWVDNATLAKGVWKHRPNSAKGSAWIRAILFIFEASESLAWSVSDADVYPVYYMLEHGRGMLDFNQALIQEVSRLSSILFPAEAEDIRLCGLSSVSQMWVKLWNSASVRGTNHLTLHQEWEENGIMDAVQIRSDIPQSWLDIVSETDSAIGKPFTELDPRNRWLFDRIMSGPRLTLKDVLNPPPWTHPEFDYSELKSRRTGSGPLECIDEELSDEEGGW